MSENTPLKTVSLSDKFDQDEGRIFISGTQAIVRLPLIQKSLDEKAGLNTAGFISGYRGSPMGMVDSGLWREKKRLDNSNIVFQPGVNEDLAATAVWGTQQLDKFPDPLVDGVFSYWYGKGPGVDRSGDVFRHGNYAGAHKNGGVLLIYGDDHPGKSSTVVCQSEPLLSTMQIPSLYPSNAQEIIDFGLLGWALSRYSGLWIGIKCVNETVEQTQTVDIDINNVNIQTPDRGDVADIVNMQAQGYLVPTQQEIIVKRHRLPLVEKFVYANNIDKIKVNGKGGLGIVTSGKSYEDVIQALELLGITTEMAEEIGLGVYKVGCIWPLEPTRMKEFADGRPELLFIEEKESILESQVAQFYINEKRSPLISGKKDPSGNPLLASDEMIEPSQIAQVIADRLTAYGRLNNDVRNRCDAMVDTLLLNSKIGGNSTAISPRIPYFCSGCPHNTSTKVPDGSMSMAGIGCHAMAIYARKDTLPPTHMGGEGMNWAGVSAFSGTQHMFQNLGDGTYFHSGLMAIRGAVAAKVNITYKILYNDAVAMTGGQPIDGPISVAQMINQVQAEGITKCILVSDSPDNYKGAAGIPSALEIYHRDDLEFVQKKMREIEGVSVLIYEQTCAAEKRRRRKRGKFPNPPKRLFINDAVCEGCGDCSVQSTCVSIQPLETELGTKRQIDQSSCNKDYSCAKGFCPSFVTVAGAEPRKSQGVALSEDLFTDLPTPIPCAVDKPMEIMIAGIGGTGVITVGAVMGMAAHIEGKACSIYDMTGLSQKNGAVYSHLKISNNPSDMSTQRVGSSSADLIMGFDLIAALSGDSAPTYSTSRTTVVGNSLVSPTSGFQFDRDLSIDQADLRNQISARCIPEQAHFVDATTLALKLCGDTIASNMFVVGYTAQKGLLPISIAALTKAIELNGVAIKFNLTAFALGRLFAHNPKAVVNLLPEAKVQEPQTLDTIIAKRVDLLTAYQDADYAALYSDFITTVKSAGNDSLTETVAKNLAKLMAYKDEYEVARLQTDPAFIEKLKSQFEDGYKLKFNLAPPLLSKKNKATGLPMKAEYGAWVFTAFRMLAKMKFLRGGAFDIFGKTAERKMERQLIVDYKQMISDTLTKLNSENAATVIELANLPDQIRGYGHVKEKSVEEMTEKRAALMKALEI